MNLQEDRFAEKHSCGGVLEEVKLTLTYVTLMLEADILTCIIKLSFLLML